MAHRPTTSDPTADAFFAALALLAAEWLDDEAPLRLPTSASPTIAAVMAYTQAISPRPTNARCARGRAVGRSLRRRFRAERTSWQEYRTTSRVLAAMALLGRADTTVLDAAVAVGFESLSGFNRRPPAHRRTAERLPPRIAAT